MAQPIRPQSLSVPLTILAALKARYQKNSARASRNREKIKSDPYIYHSGLHCRLRVYRACYACYPQMNTYAYSDNGDIYTYCAQCGFGIEINRRTSTQIHAEFYYEKDGRIWCYYCYESRKPRTVAQLKSVLAEADVLLASAKRLNDKQAIRFYTNQLDRACAALGAPEPESTLQRSLF